MFRAGFIGLFLGFLVLAGQAHAFTSSSVPGSEGYAMLEKIGTRYQPLAAKFGCARLASAGFLAGGKIADLEYIPTEEKSPRNWTRLTSITLYALSGVTATDLKLMQAIAGRMIGRYEGSDAKILKSEQVAGENGEPGLFIEYEIGKGSQREHNAGVFMRVSDSAAAFIQIQSRGKPLAPADSAQVRELLIPAAILQ